MRYAVVAVLVVAACGDNAPMEPPPGNTDTCTPFDQDIDVPITTPPIFVGDGWAFAFYSAMFEPFYARIGRDGTVTEPVPLAGTVGAPSTLAWNGTEVVIVTADPMSVALGFLAPDGTLLRTGPRQPAGRASARVVHHTGAGYDVVYTEDVFLNNSPHNYYPNYRSALPTGDWDVSLRAFESANVTATRDVGRLGDSVLALFAMNDGQLHFGAPWPSTMTSTVVGPADAEPANLAANEDTMLVVAGSTLRRYDGVSLTDVSLLTGARGVTWTGTQWELVGVDTAGMLVELRLDRDLQVVTSTPLTPVGADVSHVFVAADSDGILAAVHSEATGMQKIVRVCY